LFSAIAMGLYRRERTGKGSYVTTSLLAAGVWSCGVFVQAALCDATFFPLHDRLKPPNAILNVYQSSDDIWFLIVLTPDKWPALTKAIGRPDLLTDPRFADSAKQAANSADLTAILDQLFKSQPMSHWREAFDLAHLTFGVVHAPSEVVKDPQLRENEIVVPIAGAGGDLKFTINSPMQVQGVVKVPARRAPEIGEHNEGILTELGFGKNEIESLRAGGVLGTAPERTQGELVSRTHAG
jgi:formyl-CoA transferase